MQINMVREIDWNFLWCGFLEDGSGTTDSLHSEFKKIICESSSSPMDTQNEGEKLKVIQRVLGEVNSWKWTWVNEPTAWWQDELIKEKERKLLHLKIQMH